jgi:hypothetical protein
VPPSMPHSINNTEEPVQQTNSQVEVHNTILWFVSSMFVDAISWMCYCINRHTHTHLPFSIDRRHSFTNFTARTLGHSEPCICVRTLQCDSES